MKIAVCLIVFNGEPFIDKWMKHYTECPEVDYVCVSEGATKNMVEMLKMTNARSTDNTIAILSKYVNNPKVRITTSILPFEEKVDQQNAYMELVPDDVNYIWVADSDEFYHYEDISYIKNQLEQNKYTFVEFFMYHFWKNINTIGVGGEGWSYEKEIDRIFQYYPGARFTSHRPITMLNQEGVSVKEVNPLKAENNPVMCFHYSYIVQKNVYEKMKYYTKTFDRDYIKEWYEPVWRSWSEETKDEIESKYSIHPSNPGAKTKHVELIHPIDTNF